MQRIHRALWLLVAGTSVGPGLACVDDSTSNNAAGVTNTTSVSTGSSGAGGTAAAGGMAGAGGTAAAGGMAGAGGTSEPMVNGCSRAAANDLKGMGAVVITDVAAWTLKHQVCIVVDVGTKVTWEGNFTGHPLVGGATGTLDPMSPITKAGPGMSTTPIDVTFGSVGVYPYYCQLHLQAMQGVVYVE